MLLWITRIKMIITAATTTINNNNNNKKKNKNRYLLTYFMVQSPSSEANWFAASQEIPRISRNPKVHYRTHKPPPPVSILGQPNPVHIPTSHLLEIRPNIIHPSTPRSPQWSIFLLYLLKLKDNFYITHSSWATDRLRFFRIDMSSAACPPPPGVKVLHSTALIVSRIVATQRTDIS